MDQVSNMDGANGAPSSAVLNVEQFLADPLGQLGKGYIVGTTASRPVVLVVEDEYLLRINAVEMIAEAGFRVVEAGNADEAIAILEARPDIHIVFTDIQMPGAMDGLKLAHFIRGRWPPVKLITTSGKLSLAAGDLPEGARFLPKPYSSQQIGVALSGWAG